MSSLRIVAAQDMAARAGVGLHPKVVVVGESGRRVEITFAPMLDRDGYAPRFTVNERVGRKPLSAKAGDSLHGVTGEFVIAGRDPNGYVDAQVSVEPELATLRAIVESGERVRWEGYGPSTAGVFNITEYSETDEALRHGTNEVTRCRVTMTFTETQEAAPRLGPVSGGASPPAAAPSSPPGAAATGTTYTVKKGDTLSGIAQKQYGTANLWQRIADANGITNPKALQVGKVLTIPPK